MRKVSLLLVALAACCFLVVTAVAQEPEKTAPQAASTTPTID